MLMKQEKKQKKKKQEVAISNRLQWISWGCLRNKYLRFTKASKL
jgi:hypothetical protein